MKNGWTVCLFPQSVVLRHFENRRRSTDIKYQLTHHPLRVPIPRHKGSVRTLFSISFRQSCPSATTRAQSWQTCSAARSEPASNLNKIFSAITWRPRSVKDTTTLSEDLEVCTSALRRQNGSEQIKLRHRKNCSFFPDATLNTQINARQGAVWNWRLPQHTECCQEKLEPQMIRSCRCKTRSPKKARHSYIKTWEKKILWRSQNKRQNFSFPTLFQKWLN